MEIQRVGTQERNGWVNGPPMTREENRHEIY
jgi:hypothetical protein